MLAALSHALDLTDGQRPRHSIRTCLVGMRLADELALSADARAALYFALLLKDAGCSSNAARLAALFDADDRVVKPGMKVADWHSMPRMAIATFRHVAPGLLHDIGKLGVSNRILDKPGALDADERAAVERHPLHTWEILRRVRAFDDVAHTAALHHEKLDGSGYPWGLHAEQLDLPARLLSVADIYEALTADRPYRAGMAPAAAMAILRRDRDTRLCGVALDALAAYVD